MREQVERAAEVLKRGGIILYPTDTVWGIGCDATNAAAVERIYKLKGSVNKKGMLVLAASPDHAARYTGNVPAVAWQLMEVADKPLTLILPGAAGVAENLIPEEGTIGIRIPNDEFCGMLLRRFGRPIVSTSANKSGDPTPARYEEISDYIKTGVDFAVDKACESKQATHKPSSIIMIGESGEITILRE
jgi:L-threonylcarbamoyladenylate synthase